jgi:hypothetical protein
MPVAPIPCLVTGCNLGEDGEAYWTHVHCNSHVESGNLMRDHILIHQLNQQLAAAAAPAGPAGPAPVGLAPPLRRSATEKIARPRISEGSDDIAWETFLKQFERYKRVTGIEGQQAVDQLWYCMSEALEDAVTQDGAQVNITEAELMTKNQATGS